MNSITIKKMVPKFDTDAICSNLPYRIIMNGNTYVGVFHIITEDRLEFKYFGKDGKVKFGTILPTADDIEISPCSDMDDISDTVIQELKNTEEPVEEDEPDIKSFYICDMRTYKATKYPLFVRDNGDLVINYDFMEKLLYDDSVLIRIRFGLKAHHSYATHTFESKNVRIHVGGTTLTGKTLNEYRNIATCVEIRAGDWKQLEWAQVYILKTNDGSEFIH